MPPNILWIVTTQWRAQAFGYAGDPNARTPFMDALAAASVTFTQAVTPHPFGPFARAALLTGIPCPANGIRDYFDPLPPDTQTIAHAMRERSYTTAFLGKWHLSRRDSGAKLVGEAHARAVVPLEHREASTSGRVSRAAFSSTIPGSMVPGLHRRFALKATRATLSAKGPSRFWRGFARPGSPW